MHSTLKNQPYKTMSGSLRYSRKCDLLIKARALDPRVNYGENPTPSRVLNLLELVDVDDANAESSLAFLADLISEMEECQ